MANPYFKCVHQAFVKQIKPSLIALMEPRVTGDRADNIIKGLDFEYSHRVEGNEFSRVFGFSRPTLSR